MILQEYETGHLADSARRCQSAGHARQIGTQRIPEIGALPGLLQQDVPFVCF